MELRHRVVLELGDEGEVLLAEVPFGRLKAFCAGPFGAARVASLGARILERMVVGDGDDIGEAARVLHERARLLAEEEDEWAFERRMAACRRELGGVWQYGRIAGTEEGGTVR